MFLMLLQITSIITVDMIPMSEIFTFSALGDQFVAIRISFEMDSKLSESVVSDITTPINLYLLNAVFTLEVIGLQPSSKCYTTSYLAFYAIHHNVTHMHTHAHTCTHTHTHTHTHTRTRTHTTHTQHAHILWVLMYSQCVVNNFYSCNSLLTYV